MAGQPHGITLPEPAPLARHYRLDPNTVYLNHGSFGACADAVIEAQAAHRDRVERDAVRFYVDDLWALMDRSRAALAPVVGTDTEGLVFVANATTGVTTALHNIDLAGGLKPGDEILTTTHEYTACLNNCRAYARRWDATVVNAAVPWPVPDEAAVLDAVLSKVTARTRLAMVSLVTSATGVRLPVQKIIAALNDRGIDTILDAAHGPGCIPMRVDAWGAAWTTGNCHKWLGAPKGSAFLHARQDKRDGFRPLVLSNDAERLTEACARTNRPAFHHEFDYAGTDDATAKLTIADACEFLNGVMPGGIDVVMAHNHTVCVRARDLLCDAVGTEPPVPDSMLGPMAAFELPQGSPDAHTVKDRLYDEWRIQIPVWNTPSGRTVVRLSVQIYNSDAQYAYLADALKAILG